MMEEPSNLNTYVFDADNPTELARLIHQDRIITQAMGGPLSSVVVDPSTLRNIVDLGCGPGGWVLDVAFALPDAEVEGFDSSQPMVDYANARARTQQLPNASFGAMDITHPFELPDAAFDLVNARFLMGVLKREAWQPFLDECHRILRPGGLLRLTEAAEFGQTTSVAVDKLLTLTRQALYQLGYGFTSEQGMYILPKLLSYNKQQRYQNIQVRASALHYSSDTEAWADQFHNLDIITQQMKSVLLKLGLINEELFDDLYQEAIIDMQQSSFCGIVHITSIVGKKPTDTLLTTS
jgi:ubiquinone/menaquinone biosynthesis C-methylase UbiE